MRLIKRLSLINYGFAAAALLALLWFLSPSLREFFSSRYFMPHGHCYLWKPSLVWTMVSTNALIGSAYLSIAVCLYTLVRKIRLPFTAMFLAFGAFIFACGGTHFVEIYTLWVPNYWAAALVNVVTAIASVATAVLVFPMMPRVVAVARAAKLSEERRLELERINQELEERTEQLEFLNRELESFSYSVSHDLRAPLRGMDGFSQALLEDYSDKLDDTGRRYLHFVRDGAQSMGRIIDDLLNLSRLTRAELRIQPVDMSELARRAIATLEREEPQRKVEVTVAGSMVAEGDPGLLARLLENLLGNAWKFTSNEPHPRIEVGSQRMEGRTAYYVRDNGAGFNMDYYDKLFGPFQRLHTVQEFKGSGIGLAIAKRIVQRHGGTIWAESEVGRGATFYFTLEPRSVEPSSSVR